MNSGAFEIVEMLVTDYDDLSTLRTSTEYAAGREFWEQTGWTLRTDLKVMSRST